MMLRDTRLVRRVVTVLAIGLVLLAGGLIFWPSAPATHNQCVVVTEVAVLTFFYREDTSQQRLNQIIGSVHGRIEDEYRASNGYSIAVAPQNKDRALAQIRSYPEVTSASLSSSQQCIDQD